VLPARLARDAGRLDALGRRAPGVMAARLGEARTGLSGTAASLAALAPQATLDRGYAIVRRTGDGVIVRDPVEAPSGTLLRLRVARGELDATAGSGEPS
jgi:exodeoxyribonuclease VII large subunit